MNEHAKDTVKKNREGERLSQTSGVLHNSDWCRFVCNTHTHKHSHITNEARFSSLLLYYWMGQWAKKNVLWSQSKTHIFSRLYHFALLRFVVVSSEWMCFFVASSTLYLAAWMIIKVSAYHACADISKSERAAKCSDIERL